MTMSSVWLSIDKWLVLSVFILPWKHEFLSFGTSAAANASSAERKLCNKDFTASNSTKSSLQLHLLKFLKVFQ